MQKRLFGILASIAVIAAACGGATTSSAPPAGSRRSGCIGSRGRARRPERRRPRRRADPHASTSAASPRPSIRTRRQDSTSIAVLHALHRGLVYFDKDLKVVPALAEALPEVSADAKTLTFTLKDGDQVQQRRPDRRRRLRLQHGSALIDPRTAAPYAYVMAEVAGAAELLALLGRRTGRRPTPTSTPLLAKVGVAAPDDKTFVVTLSTSRRPTSRRRWPCGSTSPVQEKWIDQPERDRGRELRRLRPVHARHLGPQQPDRPQAEPELVRRRQADPDRDPHVDDHRAGPGPGGLRGR